MPPNAAMYRSDQPPQWPPVEDLNSVALLLDVDGTLLEIATTPAGVVVPASLRTCLRELHGKTGGAVALVSGRRLANLDLLFAPLRLPAIGGHGAEMRITGDGEAQPQFLEKSGRRYGGRSQ